MSGVFDRPSTSNWYHTALVEAFPEVQKVELLGDAADKEVSTNFFMAKCLNLRHPFVDEKGQKWGTLKGHVTVRAAGAKAIERP